MPNISVKIFSKNHAGEKSGSEGVRTCGPKFPNLPDRTLIAHGNPYKVFGSID